MIFGAVGTGTTAFTALSAFWPEGWRNWHCAADSSRDWRPETG